LVLATRTLRRDTLPAPGLTPPPDITPEDYERECEEQLRRSGLGLTEFTVTHRERLPGVDGVYQIDAVGRFEAIGVNFRVLVECKLNKRAVERDEVLAFHQKSKQPGSHKGIMFSTNGFQKSAIEYAEKHSLALFWFSDGRTSWGMKSRGPHPKPSWADDYAVWVVRSSAQGERHTILKGQSNEVLDTWGIKDVRTTT